MPNNNRRRRKNPKKGRQSRDLAVPRTPAPAYSGDVRVRMRLGIGYGVNIGPTANTSVLNDVTQSVINWNLRSADFQEYRVIGGVFHLTPRTQPTGTPTPTETKTWLSAIFESVGLPPSIGLADQILELPNADVRPMNTANPRSTKRFTWRVKDLNALLFGPVAQAPVAQFLNLVVGTNNGVAFSAWTLQVNGYLDVEFKGLATL